MQQDFTLGIEEEYLLVDKTSRDLASDPPGELMHECENRLSGRVTTEFLRAQIEVGTRVCTSIANAPCTKSCTPNVVSSIRLPLTCNTFSREGYIAPCAPAVGITPPSITVGGAATPVFEGCRMLPPSIRPITAS